MNKTVKRKIYAVHDKDLKDFLKDLNLLEKVLQGEIKCTECDCAITLENIGFISMFKGAAKICCDDLNCYYKLMCKIRGARKNEA